jgi:2-polyprenyl-3-methyl-5-hydroxy-6-metoxy-1,4-benzoquinol methylase
MTELTDQAAVDARRARRDLWNERHAGADPIESFEPNPALVAAAALLESGRALDLGCGDGRNAVWLARNGWEVSAVDFSEVAIERGRALASAAAVCVDWHVCDILEFPFEKQAYDLVTLFFIHVPPLERREILDRASSAVAPGGTLLVVGHDRSNLTDGVGGPRDATVLFTTDEITLELPDLVTEHADAVRRAGSPAPAPIDAVVRASRPTQQRPSTEID